MRFAIGGSFVPTEELIPLAKAADELGYDGFCIADHVIDLEVVETPYPYETDGKRRWTHDNEWPDPWVLIGALASVTSRLSFFTSIYVAAMRSPFQVAKSVGTAAILSGGRVSLGVGVGWCREEFDLLGQDFRTRGSRTDESIDLIKRLWTEDWVSTTGEHFPTPRLTMQPRPKAAVPILIGGLTDVALRRAARQDGWIGDYSTTDEAITIATRLRELRGGRPATVVAALTDALRPDDFARAHAGGVTDVMTQPWRHYYFGRAPRLELKIKALERFRDEVISPLRLALQGDQ